MYAEYDFFNSVTTTTSRLNFELTILHFSCLSTLYLRYRNGKFYLTSKKVITSFTLLRPLLFYFNTIFFYYFMCGLFCSKINVYFTAKYKCKTSLQLFWSFFKNEIYIILLLNFHGTNVKTSFQTFMLESWSSGIEIRFLGKNHMNVLQFAIPLT